MIGPVRQSSRPLRVSSLGSTPSFMQRCQFAFTDVAKLDAALAPLELVYCELPYAAGFLAGKAYFKYRRRQGSKHSPLPDFYIGAHAEIADYELLTRDKKRYASYFPKVQLQCP